MKRHHLKNEICVSWSLNGVKKGPTLPLVVIEVVSRWCIRANPDRLSQQNIG